MSGFDSQDGSRAIPHVHALAVTELSSFGGSGGLQAAGGQKRDHLLFLLSEGQICGGLREILDGEKSRVSRHDGDAYGAEFGAEYIRAVAWRMHPSSVDCRRVRANGDVFGDNAEPRTCSTGTC